MSNIDVSIDLHFRDSHSDKVYSVALVGNEVHYSYGRRGDSRLQPTKTFPDAVTARKEYTKMVTGKLNKGYKEVTGINGDVWRHLRTTTNTDVGKVGGDHTAACEFTKGPEAGSIEIQSMKVSRVTEKIPSGFKPQLLNEITEEEAQKYINDDAWGAQEKKNGRRHTVLLDPVTKAPIGSNKLGIIIPTFVTFRRPLMDIQLDGEAIGTKLYVFDLLRYNQYSYKDITYQQRFAALVNFHIQYSNASTEIVPLYEGIKEKQELWDRVKSSGGEGIVFKRLEAKYSEGRPNRLGDQLKVVFWQHTQARVLGITEGKRSVALACYNPNAKDWVGVGNVTIPPNYEIPMIGDYAEIRYKYYYEGGSLFQPQYEGSTDVATDLDTDFNKLLRFPGDE